jgi:hypothetical protein
MIDKVSATLPMEAEKRSNAFHLYHAAPPPTALSTVQDWLKTQYKM